MLQISIEGEDIMEHVNKEVSRGRFLACKRQMISNMAMANVICVHFSQLVKHYVT